ncbi:MAG: isochorismatase family protein [Zetaproteobacteria bacterium]|nr:isochorismatase family protein [Zetaproteobacteria bacterium]
MLIRHLFLTLFALSYLCRPARATSQIERTRVIQSPQELANYIYTNQYTDLIALMGSFDPATEAHLALGLQAYQILSSSPDKNPLVVYIPANANPVHGKKFCYTEQDRVEFLRQKIGQHLHIFIYGGELSYLQPHHQPSKFTYETLSKIQVHIPNLPITLVAGYDLVKTLPQWKHAEQLALFNWIVATREDNNASLHILTQLMTSQKNRLQPKPLHKIIPFPYPETSSTQVRHMMQKVQAIFHFVDLQETFFEKIGEMQEPGVLAVPGTAKIISNLIRMSKIGKHHPYIKVIHSMDYHFPIEVIHPKYSYEFSPKGDNLPPHGIAEHSGPEGSHRLAEIQLFEEENIDRIPPNWFPNADNTELVFTPFFWGSQSERMLSPQRELILQKNGPAATATEVNTRDFLASHGAYSVFEANVHSLPIYRYLKPQQIFVAGVAEDYCVHETIRSMLGHQLNAKIYLVIDATAAMHPKDAEKKRAILASQGVHMIRTDEIAAALESVITL